jgi:predicted permease
MDSAERWAIEIPLTDRYYGSGKLSATAACRAWSAPPPACSVFDSVTTRLENSVTMILPRLIPLVGFIGLGILLRARNLLSVQTVDQFKWFIVYALLPGVLFKTFLLARLAPGLVAVAASVFGVNVVMYVFGLLLGRGLRQGGRYTRFLTSGMEYGMLGLGLFTSLYGLARLEYIAVVDLGHEFFFWFLFIPVFSSREEGARGIPFKAIVTSPINLSILAGLVLNLSGVSGALVTNQVGQGVMSLCDMMGAAIGPLILVVIGYGLRFERAAGLDVLFTVLARLALAVCGAYLVGELLIGRLLGWGRGYTVAVWLLFLTAPSFSVPIFARPRNAQEQAYISSTIAVYTVITFAAAAVLLNLFPVI